MQSLAPLSSIIKPTKIAHISDTHFPVKTKVSGRYEEYNSVIDGCVEHVKNLANEWNVLAIITGDVLDNKERLDADNVLMARRLVGELASVCSRVIVISGNHDIVEPNLENSTDSLLSVCYEAPNVDHLVDTGVYQLEVKECRLNFVVSSLTDESGTFLTIDKAKALAGSCKPSDKWIKLYHGAIVGAKTDTNYVVKQIETTDSSRFRTKEEFEGFDAVLLGDIHKHQHVGKPQIAYAGSLVQKNFGEKVEGHGILEWWLESGTFVNELVEIYNPYCYINVYVDAEGNLQDTFMLDRHRDKKIRVCLKARQKMSHSAYEHCLQKLKAYRIEFVKCQLAEKATTKEIKAVEPTIDDSKLVKEKVLEECEDPALADKVLELHQSMASEPECNDFVTQWSVNWLEFQNILIYGGNHVNRVDLKSGVCSISAPNACGKSTLIEILTLALFDKCSSEKGNILSLGAKKGFINCEFISSNRTFHVRKSLTTQRHRCDVFLINSDGSEEKLTKESVPKTYSSVMVPLVGTLENFLKHHVISTRYPFNLLTCKPSEMLIHFAKICNTEKFEKYVECVRKQKNELEKSVIAQIAALRVLRDSLPSNLQNENDVREIEKSLERGRAERVEIKSKLDGVIGKLESSEGRKSGVQCSINLLYTKAIRVDEPKMGRSEAETLLVRWGENTFRKPEEILREKSKIENEIEKYVKLKGSATETKIRSEIEQHSQFLKDKYKIDVSIHNADRLCSEYAANLHTSPIRKCLKACESKLSKITATTRLSSLSHIDKHEDSVRYVMDLMENQPERIKCTIDNPDDYDVEINRCNLTIKRLPSSYTGDSVADIERKIYKLEAKKEALEKECASKGLLLSGSTTIIEGCDKEELERQKAEVVFVNVPQKSSRSLQELKDLLVGDFGRQLKTGSTLFDLNEWVKSLETPYVLDESTKRDILSTLECIEKNSDKNAYVAKISGLIQQEKERLAGERINKQNKEKLASIERALALLRIKEISAKIVEIDRELDELHVIKNIGDAKDRLKQLTLEQENFENFKAHQKKIIEAKRHSEWLMREELLKTKKRCEEELEKAQLNESIYECLRIINYELFGGLKAIQSIERLEQHLDQLNLELKVSIANQALAQYKLYDAYLQNKAELERLKKIVDEVNIEIQGLRDDERTLRKKLEESAYQQELEYAVNNARCVLKELKKKQEQLTNDEAKLRVFVEYVRLFSRDKIPLQFLKDKIEGEFCELVSNTLQKYTGYSLVSNFEKSGCKYKLNFRLEKDGKDAERAVGPNALSGFEGVVLKLAVNQACVKMSERVQSQILFIDEALDCLDSLRFDQDLLGIVGVLSSYYATCVIISHRHLPPDVADYSLCIKNKKKYSQIQS